MTTTENTTDADRLYFEGVAAGREDFRLGLPSVDLDAAHADGTSPAWCRGYVAGYETRTTDGGIDYRLEIREGTFSPGSATITYGQGRLGPVALDDRVRFDRPRGRRHLRRPARRGRPDRPDARRLAAQESREEAPMR